MENVVVAEKTIEIFGQVMNEHWLTVKPLNTAAFVYLAACFAYVFALAKVGTVNQKRWVQFASTIAVTAWVFHTIGMAGRWYVGGFDRPPWTNLYESLIGFAWMFSSFQIYAIYKWGTPLLGTIVTPLIFLLMGMSVMTSNKSVEPLIPALQSYWLKIHVVFGMLAYAGFSMAASFAFFQLVKSRLSLSKIGAGLSLVILLNLGIAGGNEFFNTGNFYLAKTVLRTMPDGTQQFVKDAYRESENGPVITRMEEVPAARWQFYLSISGFLASAILMGWKRKENPESEGQDISGAGFVAFWVGFIGLVGLCAGIVYGVQSSATLTLQSNPYLIMLLSMTVVFASVYLIIVYRYEKFLAAIPSAERLDELAYKNILFAFPFQTLLLVTGAVWAYYAWGRSWGWDPKETWALITFLVYLIYLHLKLLFNAPARILSVITIFGFVVMVFAFLGVNLVLSGLHSYGAA